MERRTSIAFEGIDSETPLNTKLNPKYIRSFAHHTMKDRLPVILTKVINDLVTHKGEILQERPKEAEEELKAVIGKISKLKNELVTNKPLIRIESKGEDVNDWNDYLEFQSQTDLPCWYYSPWLYSECYMYRRLCEAFEDSQTLQDLDPFTFKKREAFQVALPEIRQVSKDFLSCLRGLEASRERLQELFVGFLKLSLWSNKCDLSLSAAEHTSQDQCSFTKLNELNQYILCDDSLQVYDCLMHKPNGVIDFVTDNASYELFSDLCFCDFLCASSLVSKIRFHVKRLPWYVSDATRNDVNWLLSALDKENLTELSGRWRKYLDDGTWSISDEKYWTLPFDYDSMRRRDQDLFNHLSESGLVIMKGDLNYRKLLGDINWDPSEKFDVVLREFKPTNVLTLRTVKADLICGLSPGKFDEITMKNKMWMRTGDYAVVQFYRHN